METTSVSSKKFRKILYGRARCARVGIEVNSDHTLNIHTVLADELDLWRGGLSFHGSSFFRRRCLDVEFVGGIEFKRDWCLILENISGHNAEVDYDVYERVKYT